MARFRLPAQGILEVVNLMWETEKPRTHRRQACGQEQEEMATRQTKSRPSEFEEEKQRSTMKEKRQGKGILKAQQSDLMQRCNSLLTLLRVL